ncbi:MAG: aminotransferase class III-fold pyridoxal phosphate-dependent enzyme [Symbiobacteriaceae bacterium]|nr:aminotransferase class III-fold pyridoxal phosphate-dependent enzyme [Symbiobacteriaceae bacterium]
MELKNNMAWVARDAEVIAPFTKLSYYPLAVQSAKGSIITDVDGNRFIDMLSSAASQNLGYAHPAIAEAVRAQMDDYTNYTNVYVYNPRAVELAEMLVAIAPGEQPKKVAFGLSGSDSIDGAIKLARAYTGRNKLITFQGAYHGSTFGALSLSFINPSMRKGLGSLLSDVYAFPYPCAYRDGSGGSLATLESIENAFSTWLPPTEVAAMIIEPLQGDNGMIVPPDGFIASLAELCAKHGILLICDEIQQGLMRTGRWFGIEHTSVIPDIIVAGKALGGGLPLGAIIASSEIMDTLSAPAHTFTLGANATCCAAGLAMLRVMSQPGFVADLERRSALLKEGLSAIAKRHNCVGDVRGYGFSLGVDIVSDRDKKTADAQATKKICYRGWESGLLMIWVGKNVLRIQPSLLISEEEIQQAIAILESCICDLENGKIPDSVLSKMQGW